MYQISVACGCDIGRVRARNEDNIYLNGRTLEQNNRGLKGILTAKYLLDTEKCFAVFDGMGGEQAETLRRSRRPERCAPGRSGCRNMWCGQAPF